MGSGKDTGKGTKRRRTEEDVGQESGAAKPLWALAEGLRNLMGGRNCSEEELTREVLLQYLKAKGDIREVEVDVKGHLDLGTEMQLPMDLGTEMPMDLGTEMRLLEAGIEEAEDMPVRRQNLLMLAAEGSEEPLPDTALISGSCTVALRVAVKPDCTFLNCGSDMTISEPDALTVTKQSDGDNLATGSVVVGSEDGLTRAYFELCIDSGMNLDGNLVGCMIGAVRDGLDYENNNKYSNDAWLLYMHDGSLWGNSKRASDEQGEGTLKVGDRVGVLIDTEGGGRVLFFKNGQQFGPGFVGGVSGLVLGVHMYFKGCQVTLLPDAEEPAEPFTKWEGYL